MDYINIYDPSLLLSSIKGKYDGLFGDKLQCYEKCKRGGVGRDRVCELGVCGACRQHVCTPVGTVSARLRGSLGINTQNIDCT